MRRTSTSTPKRAERPAHTPPRTPRDGSRRRATSVTRQPRREQHGADRREDRRAGIAQAQVEYAGLVEQEQEAEARHHDTADEGHGIPHQPEQASEPAPSPARSTSMRPTPARAS